MEDTPQKEKNPEDAANESIIQEMLRDAKTAAVPSDLEKNPIIHRGDAELPTPMTVNKVSNTGYVWIWDTRTYDKVPCLYYMLPSKLRLRRKDGSFVFTTTDPGKKPARGTVKCMLHRDDENRAHYDELGFRVCPKANITNKYQLEQHMRKRHPQEWATIEKERIDKERSEDRALQKLLLMKAAGETLEVKQETSSKDIGQVTDTPKNSDNIKAPFICSKCGADFGNEKVKNNHEETCKG